MTWKDNFGKIYKIAQTLDNLLNLQHHRKQKLDPLILIAYIMSRDRKKLHLFGHLLRNKIAEIIAKIAQKIARKIEKLHGVLDYQNFYTNLMFFKVVVFMKKSTKNKLFLNEIALNCNLSTKLHCKKLAKNPFFKKMHLIATYTQNCIKLHKILVQNLFY